MTSTRAREESERETRPLVASARGHAYAVGGYGGGTKYVDTLECLDLGAAERGWHVAASLPAPRAGAVAGLGPDHCLYVVGGGNNGNSNFSSMIKWDQRSNRWSR